jgi:hypothetical protein
MYNLENEHIINLIKEDSKKLIDITEQFSYNPYINPDLFCKEAKELSKSIPENIKQILNTFSKYGNKKGFLLIKNIPINNFEIIKTPESNNLHIGETTYLAKIQAIIMNYIGDMIGYEAECNGNLFQDIVPVKNMENNQTSVGSNTELEIHTEQAFSNLRPDILSLACLRGDEKALTYILPVNTIIENLTSDEINLLYKPLWKTGVDLSFKLNGHEFIEGDIRGPISILNEFIDDPKLIFDQDLMEGTTEESKNLIKKIVNIYYKHRICHNLKPGEIILIDNNRAVHGRSSFFPIYDGNDRFLIRCFGTFDYEKSKYARLNDSRTILAIYS